MHRPWHHTGLGGVLTLPLASWLLSAGHLAPLGCSFSDYKMKIKECMPPRRCWMNPGNYHRRNVALGTEKTTCSQSRGQSRLDGQSTHCVVDAGSCGGNGDIGKGKCVGWGRGEEGTGSRTIRRELLRGERVAPRELQEECSLQVLPHQTCR